MPEPIFDTMYAGQIKADKPKLYFKLLRVLAYGLMLAIRLF